MRSHPHGGRTQQPRPEQIGAVATPGWPARLAGVPAAGLLAGIAVLILLAATLALVRPTAVPATARSMPASGNVDRPSPYAGPTSSRGGTTRAVLTSATSSTFSSSSGSTGGSSGSSGTSSTSSGTSSSGTSSGTSSSGTSSSGTSGSGTSGSGTSGSGTSGSGTGGTASGVGSTAAGPISNASYWLVASDGGVFSFGGLPFYGSMGGKHLNKPVVGLAPAPGGTGYWEVASDGGIFAFHAPFYGSMGGTPLNKPVVGMAVDPATGGYWLVASDGGIFAFHAPFYGSMGGTPLNAPIVGMAAMPDGDGYWMVASDGGIFSFGAAQFYGSTGGTAGGSPIVGMASTTDGEGYWVAAADGSVYAYGDAPFEGSLGADPLTYPVVAIASTGVAGNGYWLTNANGAVSSFGDAGNFGSAPQHLDKPIVGIADGPGNGSVTDTAAPPGSFGYDVSSYQCNQPLPSGHVFGIVQATGWSGSAPNPCLSTQAQWAGGGLQLYLFLSDGSDNTNQPGCNNDPHCNFGFEAATYAYDYVQSQKVNPAVPWWIDVEPANWSSDTAANDQVIEGALIELRGLGVNTVGIYTSPLTWSTIAGNYQPPVPVWLAWYTNEPVQNCNTGMSYAASNQDFLPSGGILFTQYTDNAAGLGIDGDYAC